jgi:ABC-type multidrug transport system ATPase subunit
MAAWAKVRMVATGQEWHVTAADEVFLGRASTCTLRFDERTVSGRHARLVYAAADGWVLEDLQSRNGTFVGGVAIDRHELDGPTTLRLADPLEGPEVVITPGAAPEPPLPDLDDDVPTLRRGADRRHDDAEQDAARAAPGRTVVVGRASSCDLVVDDLLVSRQHAQVRLLGGGRAEVRDLGSANGTFVSGRRVRDPVVVHAGQRITLGTTVLRFDGEDLQPAGGHGDVVFSVEHLCVGAPGARRLDDVTFTLAERSFLAVLGSSGAGKSTLLKAITGTEPATSGRISFDGRDLYRDFAELRHQVGYVPQEEILHPQLTVTDTLELAAALRFPSDTSPAERSARVAEVLGELGLSDRRELRVARLSGGQRKRLSVALELLTRPALLILDEPTSGLDPGNERSLMELLRQLADGGRSVIVVTHSTESLHLCDRLLLLGRGGVPVFYGPTPAMADSMGVDDLTDVFAALEQGGAAGAVRAVLAPTTADAADPPPTRAVPVQRGARPVRSPRHEVAVLTRRYLRVLAGDRRNLLILGLQGPVIALLMWAVFGADHLVPGADGLSLAAGNVLMALVLAMIYIGASNSVREIVKERHILRRELNFGLSTGAYLASKVLVLGAITLLQAAVLVALATARQGGLGDPLVLPWGRGELYVVVALCGLSALGTGLLLSALVATADKAMTLLPVLLFAQFLLAGLIFPVSTPVVQQLSWLTTARWGFAGAASTADFWSLRGCGAVGLPGAEASCSTLWHHDAGHLLLDMAALAVLFVASLVLARRVLRRSDPAVALARVHAGRPERGR